MLEIAYLVYTYTMFSRLAKIYGRNHVKFGVLSVLCSIVIEVSINLILYALRKYSKIEFFNYLEIYKINVISVLLTIGIVIGIYKLVSLNLEKTVKNEEEGVIDKDGF